jgi:outer membrane protein assembly factor BamB
MNRRRLLARAGQLGAGLLGLAGGAEPTRAPAAALTGEAPAKAAADTDWPVYRHDVALTGVSPGKGRILEPQVQWEYHLGAPYVSIATDRAPAPGDVADLDGDGRPERFSIEGRTIRVADMDGLPLWSHTVEGQPLGGNVRVARLAPDRSGLQILSFSGRMDTGDGQGYCFAFDRGARQGELLWTTGPLSGQYAPTLIVDDVDGDGLPEVVTAPHYRVQIFNGQTGALKAEIPWDVGRNYGALVSRPRRDRPQKDLFIVCDFVLHVDCIRFQGGRWVHAWGHKYVEPNAPVPRGREMYIRVGPRSVADLDGDGRDEMVYMLVDAGADDRWHMRVRDGETGEVKADLPGVWLWSVDDFDGDGREEIAYTPTPEKRPPTYCDLRIARFARGRLEDLAALKRVRPLLVNATLPLSAHTIADEGLLDLLHVDLDGDRRPEIWTASRSPSGRGEDGLAAMALTSGGELRRTWHFERSGHRLNLIHAGPDERGERVVRVRDLTAGRLLTVDAGGKITQEAELGQPGGFSTTPVAVDLDGDGRNEIVLQNAAEEIVALRAGKQPGERPGMLWSLPGVAMNPSPGYARNGPLCPQAADLDGDGRPEVVFASEDEDGRCAVTCVDGRGKRRWRRSIEGCPWGGLQAGVNLWTFGRFTGRARGLDVYVDIHRRSKGSSEGWVLRGDTGEVVWRRQGLVAAETAMPFGGGLPAVADLNRDGVDDLAQEFYTVYGAISGKTGEPLFPPAFLPGAGHFGKWIAYSSPTVADLDGDGQLDVYLNSASYARGGYAAVRADGKPLWVEFHDNEQGSDGFGPVGDFDGDGKLEIAVPVLNGTLLCLNAADGSHRWQIRAPVTGDVVAADVNGDGILELLFAGRDGRLRAVSGRDGRELWSIAAPGRPVVADVDGDGFVEVLTVGGDGMLRAVGPHGR